MRHHVIITGTGRAGTTFLMELLTVLGLDTGFDRSQFPFDEACRAGLEFGIRQPNAPYIVKDPCLCETLAGVLAEDDVTIDHAVIPMRDLFAAAESRRVNVRAALEVDPKAIPRFVRGGAVGSDDLEEQEQILARQFYGLMVTIAEQAIPVTLLPYPRFMADPEWLYDRLPEMLRGPSKEAFVAAHREVYRPELVHDYRPPPNGTEPNPPAAN